jgi:rhodanese-related sulfurtransferase
MKKILAAIIFAALFFCFTVQNKQPAFNSQSAYRDKDTHYTCLPCGYSCDSIVYNKPGMCSHCNMHLVDKAGIRFGSIEPDALCSFIMDMGRDKVVLLDVRTKEEFEGKAPDKFGHLAGAVNIPVQVLPQRMKELQQYKDKEIIVYCSHSHRSPMASYLLMQNGFTKVTNMEYGMSEWKNKVKPDACNKKLYVKQ